jgi:hypothetical protein
VSEIFVGRLPRSIEVERFEGVMGGSWVFKSGCRLKVVLT